MGETKTQLSTGAKLIIGGIALFFIIIFIIIIFPVVVVNAGERGVVMKYGQVQNSPLNEGLHLRVPFQDEVKIISVKTKTTEITGAAGSSDSQVINFKAQVNWRMNPSTISRTFQGVGDEEAVEISYIQTKGPDSIKESVSKSTAINFQRNREIVRNLAIQNLRKRMGNVAIIEDISFTNIAFSAEFDASIEAKVTAEQEAQTQKNKLESVKYQAQQRIETAKAEAESIRIKNEALAANPALIEYEKALALKINAEKFPIVPNTILGGAVPFFNVQQ